MIFSIFINKVANEKKSLKDYFPNKLNYQNYCNKYNTEEFCNLNEVNNLNFTQNEILKDKQIKLRNLDSSDTWIVNSGCGEVLSYYSEENNGIKKITRTGNVKQNEGYVYLKNKPDDYFDFKLEMMLLGKTITWKINLINILEGGVFFGVCSYDSTSLDTCLDAKDTPLNKVLFSGIGISYFSENCYHIDQYFNNQYWTTPKHCLSEWEVLNLQFDFYLNYDKSMGNNAKLIINYDDFKYYDRNNIIVKRDEFKKRKLESTYMCIHMLPNDSAIEISDSTFNFSI